MIGSPCAPTASATTSPSRFTSAPPGFSASSGTSVENESRPPIAAEIGVARASRWRRFTRPRPIDGAPSARRAIASIGSPTSTRSESAKRATARSCGGRSQLDHRDAAVRVGAAQARRQRARVGQHDAQRARVGDGVGAGDHVA